MNEKPQVRTIPKQRLLIINLEMDVPYAQGTKFLDRVHAKNLSLPEDHALFEKVLRMTVFNGDLKSFIRGKENIIADIEERDRPDQPEYGPDRTIVQVYDDNGEPVSRKKGGGGNYRRTLEEDLALEAVKRRSIEGQASVAQIGALLTSREIEGDALGISEDGWKRNLEKYWKAVEKGLDNYLADPTPQAAKPRQDPPPKADKRAQDKKSKAEKPDQVSNQDQPPEAIKHVGDLFTRASKLKPPVTPAEIKAALGKSATEVIEDLDVAWAKAEELSLAKYEAFEANKETPQLL